MNDTATRHPPGEEATLFLKALGRLGPAELSALRRATGQPLGSGVRAYDIFRDLFHTVRRRYPTTKWASYFTATLYPWHPKPGGSGSLAQALRRIRPLASQREARRRADQRFVSLLDAQGHSSLFTELAACVRALSRADVPIDWPQIFEDLTRWYTPDQPVQKAWANSYFGND